MTIGFGSMTQLVFSVSHSRLNGPEHAPRERHHRFTTFTTFWSHFDFPCGHSRFGQQVDLQIPTFTLPIEAKKVCQGFQLAEYIEPWIRILFRILLHYGVLGSRILNCIKPTFLWRLCSLFKRFSFYFYALIIKDKTRTALMKIGKCKNQWLGWHWLELEHRIYNSVWLGGIRFQPPKNRNRIEKTIRSGN